MRCITFILILFIGCKVYAQSSIEAKIDYSQAENRIVLKSFAKSTDDVFYDLNYLFIAIKQNENKTLSNHQQQGKVIIHPYEQQFLSEIRINLNGNEELKAYLFLRDDDKNILYAKDSIHLKHDGQDIVFHKNENHLKSIPRDEFVLMGVIIDETKTKGGKDFFDLFYSLNQLRNEQFPFITTISELPEFGRTSFIQIQDRDKILYKFRVVPNEDYLNQQAEIVFKILNQYRSEQNLLQRELNAP